ncbi:MAG: hypothetical protein QM581_12725 [Pseudomonas sp.]
MSYNLMEFLRILVNTALVATAWLALLAIVFTLLIAIPSFFVESGWSVKERISQFISLVAVTLIFGSAPIIFFFSPLYTLFKLKKVDHWWLVLILGLSPGIFLATIPHGAPFAVISCTFGAAVSLLTHASLRGWRRQLINQHRPTS